MEKREKLFQLEKDYPWLKDRFEASHKALFDYCGTQNENQLTDLEQSLLFDYRCWNCFLTSTPEVKEAKEIHLALVVNTIIQIAYKFRKISQDITRRNNFTKDKSTETINKEETKKRKRQVEKLVNETSLPEKKIKKALNLIEFKQSFNMSEDQWKQIEETYVQESSIQESSIQ